MKIALVGNNDGPLRLAQALKTEGIIPVCLGLQKPLSGSLKKAYTPWENDTTVFSDFDEAALLDYLSDFKIDLLVNCFCNFKFVELLEYYETLNVHLAPLPRYRGRHPLQWALINGEGEFGVTIHRMNLEFDAGEILWQDSVPIDEGMSVFALRERLLIALENSFGNFIKAYQNGKIEPLPNIDSNATYVPRRYPEDSALTEWDDSAKIVRKVMALRSEAHPAFLRLGNREIPVKKASVVGEARQLPAQPIVYGVSGNTLEISCTDGKIVRLFNLETKKIEIKQNQTIL